MDEKTTNHGLVADIGVSTLYAYMEAHYANRIIKEICAELVRVKGVLAGALDSKDDESSVIFSLRIRDELSELQLPLDAPKKLINESGSSIGDFVVVTGVPIIRFNKVNGCLALRLKITEIRRIRPQVDADKYQAVSDALKEQELISKKLNAKLEESVRIIAERDRTINDTRTALEVCNRARQAIIDDLGKKDLPIKPIVLQPPEKSDPIEIEAKTLTDRKEASRPQVAPRLNNGQTSVNIFHATHGVSALISTLIAGILIGVALSLFFN